MSEKINANAWYDLSLVYFCGNGVEKDFVKARQLLKIAVDNGCAAAKKLADDIIGVADSDIALVIVKQTGCDPEGGDTLPSATAEDVASYKEKLYKAAEGDAVVARELASMYRNGLNPVVKNARASRNWLRRVCCDGDGATSLALGISLYESGSEEAAPLFEKLIAAGVNEAKYYLGECYCRGLGVEKNVEKAAELLLQRTMQNANDGDADSQLELAGTYAIGNGIDKDLVMSQSLG